MRTAASFRIFLFFCRKKLSINARGGTIESFFLHFYKNNYPRLCVAFWQSAFWKSCVSPVGPPLPCRFPRIRMILFAVLYIIYKLLQFVSFLLFLQRRRFLAILFAFFVYFYVLSKISGEFFVQNKTRNTKRRIFLFFSSVVRKFLSMSLFSSALSFLSLRSPLLRRKSRELIFSLRSIFLSSAQKKTRISLSALPAAACVLRVFFCRIESFILPKSAE